jgi:hypothetical protein
MKARTIFFATTLFALLGGNVLAAGAALEPGGGRTWGNQPPSHDRRDDGQAQGQTGLRDGAGDEGGVPVGELEGTWNVTVSLIGPPPGFGSSFTALETYARGGGLVTTNNLPPVARPGLGSWARRGRSFAVSIQFFLFDASGSPAGLIRVRHRINLDRDDEYFGEGLAQFFDAHENVLLTVPFTSHGRRLTPSF